MISFICDSHDFPKSYVAPHGVKDISGDKIFFPVGSGFSDLATA